MARLHARSHLVALLLGPLAALPAAAQVQHVGDPLPSGLALPVTGAAAAEEATALAVNPAGPGFVAEPTLHYLHAGAADGSGSRGDGVYAAGLLGPIGPSLGLEWQRPGSGPRYRLTTLGLALSDGHAVSLGVAWRWWSSPDRALEALRAWDAGLTVRPGRHLSLALSAQGYDARLGGARLPVRYDLGMATRLWRDGLTLAVDLLGDDRGRDALYVSHAAAGLQVELGNGLGLSAQLRAPIRSGPAREVATVLALGWSAPHAGWTGGVTTRPGETSWFAGARLSRERYRAAPGGDEVPRLDLARQLSPPGTLWLLLGERDGYGALLRRLERARVDGDVAAVVLQISELPLGGGRIEELRAAVAALARVKPVLAYLTGGGTKEYWLACAASAVALPPSSVLAVTGLGRSQLYLKDGLARLGVVVEVAKAGAYKSAPEPLTRSGPSPEAREVTEALLGDVAGRIVADVAAARRLAPEVVRQDVDQGLFTATGAREAGLIDAVLWPDELEGWVRRATGRPLRLDAGWRPSRDRAAQRWGRPAAIAVVRLEGMIAPGASRREPLGGDGLAGAETVVAEIRRAAADPRVRAIVLRVESPGGDAAASDLVWRELTRARAKKPVVASFGDLAASGGYLAAMGTDYIVAEPSTLTGSIGVFALKPDLSGLLEKLSLHRDVSQRGQVADLYSVTKPWTPAERAAVEKMIEAVYAGFLDKVAENRRLPRAEVEALAGGRVWTGAQALERRLVDALGGLPEALAEARRRAGLGADEDVEVVGVGGGLPWLPVPLEDGAKAVAGLLPAGEPPALGKLLGALPEVRTAAQLLELGPVLALPVEWVAPAP